MSYLYLATGVELVSIYRSLGFKGLLNEEECTCRDRLCPGDEGGSCV